MKDGLFVSSDRSDKQNQMNQDTTPRMKGLGFGDLIRIGFVEGLLAHKLRTLLTMLGVIIGVASVIAMSSFTQGSKQKQIDQPSLGSKHDQGGGTTFRGLTVNQARLRGSGGFK